MYLSLSSTQLLKFGEFTLKSGRKAPYFINTGNYKTGAQLARLGGYYAACIQENGLTADTLVGPAYKGIPLAVTTAVALFEKLLSDAKVDKDAYDKLVDNILKQRIDDKASQIENFVRLRNYIIYGKVNPSNNILSEKELRQLDPQALLDCLKNLPTYKHHVAYYGPSSQEDVLAIVEKEHKMADTLADLPERIGVYLRATDIYINGIPLSESSSDL